jgi:hypothetical protein
MMVTTSFVLCVPESGVEYSEKAIQVPAIQRNWPGALIVEFPTKSGQGVNGYSVRSYSAGETYPSDEWRRWRL